MTLEEIGNKVDRALTLLEGNGQDSPGVIGRLAVIERLMYGKSSDGMLHRVNMMWKVHIWILCTMSGAVGFGFKALIDYMTK